MPVLVPPTDVVKGIAPSLPHIDYDMVGVPFHPRKRHEGLVTCGAKGRARR